MLSHMDMWLIMKKIILAFVLNIVIKKEKKKKISLNWIFDKFSKSKPLAPLNQSICPMYDDLTYDEDPHIHSRGSHSLLYECIHVRSGPIYQGANYLAKKW